MTNSMRQKWRYQQTINAGPEVIFPLLCPVREQDWLAGWQYRMIYSESGVAELNAVFATPEDSGEETVWTVTRYQPDEYAIHFARFTPDSRVCRLEVQVVPDTSEQSKVDIVYVYTATSDAGTDFLENFGERKFLVAMRFWEDSMNHFLATGERFEG